MNASKLLPSMAATGLLVAGSAGMAAMLPQSAEASAPVVAECAQPDGDGVTEKAASRISGSFSFSQAVLTPTNEVNSVFAKAASALCDALPTYAISVAGSSSILVGTDDGAQYLSVESAAEDNPATMTVGCSCASNVAGGGAMANVQIQGVSIASVLAQTIA